MLITKINNVIARAVDVVDNSDNINHSQLLKMPANLTYRYKKHIIEQINKNILKLSTLDSSIIDISFAAFCMKLIFTQNFTETYGMSSSDIDSICRLCKLFSYSHSTICQLLFNYEKLLNENDNNYAKHLTNMNCMIADLLNIKYKYKEYICVNKIRIRNHHLYHILDFKKISTDVFVANVTYLKQKYISKTFV